MGHAIHLVKLRARLGIRHVAVPCAHHGNYYGRPYQDRAGKNFYFQELQLPVIFGESIMRSRINSIRQPYNIVSFVISFANEMIETFISVFVLHKFIPYPFRTPPHSDQFLQDQSSDLVRDDFLSSRKQSNEVDIRS